MNVKTNGYISSLEFEAIRICKEMGKDELTIIFGEPPHHVAFVKKEGEIWIVIMAWADSNGKVRFTRYKGAEKSGEVIDINKLIAFQVGGLEFASAVIELVLRATE